MKKNWSNTALVAYSCLPKIVGELDLALKSRVNSTFMSKHLKNGVSTEQLIGEIMKINEQKRKILLLRETINKSLGQLNPTDSKLLYMRIIQKKTFQDISTELQISLRTVFRRLDLAELSFQKELDKLGKTDEWFEREFADCKYIMSIRTRVLEDKYFLAKSM